VFILVQCNTSLSKNYPCCTFNNCSLCDRLNLRKKFVRALWLTVHTVWNQSWNKDFPTNLHSITRLLDDSSDFESIENVPSSNAVEFEFELCHIPRLRHLWNEMKMHAIMQHTRITVSEVERRHCITFFHNVSVAPVPAATAAPFFLYRWCSLQANTHIHTSVPGLRTHTSYTHVQPFSKANLKSHFSSLNY